MAAGVVPMRVIRVERRGSAIEILGRPTPDVAQPLTWRDLDRLAQTFKAHADRAREEAGHV